MALSPAESTGFIGSAGESGGVIQGVRHRTRRADMAIDCGNMIFLRFLRSNSAKNKPLIFPASMDE